MPANPTQGTTFEIAEIYPLGGEDNPKSAVDLRQGIIQFQYFEDLMFLLNISSSNEKTFPQPGENR